MDRRIVYDQSDADGVAQEPRRSSTTGGPNRLRLAARNRRERGRGAFRYHRRHVAQAAGVAVSAVYTAERRGELSVSDLVSVARFIVRRVERAERRRVRDTRRKMSVKGSQP